MCLTCANRGTLLCIRRNRTLLFPGTSRIDLMRQIAQSVRKWPSVRHYRRFKRYQRRTDGNEVKGRPRPMRHPQRMAFLWSCLSMRENAVAHAYRVPEKYAQRGSTCSIH